MTTVIPLAIRWRHQCAVFVEAPAPASLKWCGRCGWARSSHRYSRPRFDKTYCSQCGGCFGPGNEGYSHCSDHAFASWCQSFVRLLNQFGWWLVLKGEWK